MNETGGGEIGEQVVQNEEQFTKKMTEGDGGVVAVVVTQNGEGAVNVGGGANISLEDGNETDGNSQELVSREQESTPKIETFEDFSLRVTTLFGASEALLNTIPEEGPVSDAVINQLSVQISEVNLLLKQNFSEHDDQELYSRLHELKPRLLEIKLRRIKDDYSGPISSFSQLEGSPEEKVAQFSVELAKLVTQDSQQQEKVAAAFKKMLERSGVTLDRTIDTFVDAYKKIVQMDADEVTDPDEAGSIQELEEAFQTEEASPVGEKGKKLKNFRKYAKTFGAVALFTGQSFKELTFDKNNLDLGAFFSFILNPTGRFAASELLNFVGEKGEVPYHIFKEKFRNFKDVGSALALCSQNLMKYPGFNTWEGNNRTTLESLKTKSSSTKTVEVFAALQKDAFTGTDSEGNWKLFAKEFATVLFGSEKFDFGPEIIEFMKELLSDEAKKLKEYWNIGADVQPVSEKTSSPQNQEVGGQTDSSTTVASTVEVEPSGDTNDISEQT